MPTSACALAASPSRCSLACRGPASAQSSREAERKLEEGQARAEGRRRPNAARSKASAATRRASCARPTKQVGRSSRALRDTETRARPRPGRAGRPAAAPRRRCSAGLAAQREELARLLRAAYTQWRRLRRSRRCWRRTASPTRSARSPITATLQRDRAQRIRELTASCSELDALERADRRRAAARSTHARAQQRTQLAQLEQDRDASAPTLVAQLDQRYQDRARARAGARPRRQGAGAAARATARRRGEGRRSEQAAADARRAPKAKAARSEHRAASTPLRPAVGAGPALQVGGLGWPLSGSAAGAATAAPMPDGRSSEGLLIAAAAGTTVKAVADGRVVFADWMTGYGLILIVDHGNGYMSLYAHNDALLQGCRRRGEARRCGGHRRQFRRPGPRRRCISNCAATASRSIPTPGCRRAAECAACRSPTRSLRTRERCHVACVHNRLQIA